MWVLTYWLAGWTSLLSTLWATQVEGSTGQLTGFETGEGPRSAFKLGPLCSLTSAGGLLFIKSLLGLSDMLCSCW